MRSSRDWFRDARTPIVIALAGIAWLSWLLVTDREISVWGDLRRDVTLREAYDGDMIDEVRFYDSSPHSIWLPSDVFVRDSVRRMELPLWDRSQAGGYSPLLNLQNGVFHPIRWLTVLVPRELTGSVIIIVSLTTFGIGVFLLARRVYEASEIASLIGAIVATTSGFMLSVAHFSGMMIPMIHAPWIVVLFSRWSKTRGTWDAIGLALVSGLLLISGHPLLVLVSLGLAGCLIAWDSMPRGRRAAAMYAGCIVLLGFLAMSAFTIPMLLEIPHLWSYKNQTPQGLTYEGPRFGQFDALLATIDYEPYPGELFDGGPIAFHFGPLALALVLIGACEALRHRQARIIPVLIGLGWIVSMPPAWFVKLASAMPLAYYKPWYLMLVLVLPASLAAAFAFDWLKCRLPGAMQVVAGLSVVAGVMAGAAQPWRDVFRTQPAMPIDSPALRFLKAQEEPFRVVGLSGQTHVPNLSSITGVEDVRFSSPVHPERYHQWLSLAMPRWAEDFPSSTIIHDASSPHLRVFNVRFVLRSTVPGHDVQTFLPRPGSVPPDDYIVDSPPGEAFSLAWEDDSIEVYDARDDAHPRAHFAEKFHAVSGGLPSAVAAMRSADVPINTEVVEVPAVRGGLLTMVEPPNEGDGIELEYPSSSRVVIHTTTSGPRLLVLHDSWHRGWKAEVNGRRTDLFPVSVLSRGLVVPGGSSRVEMTFVPPGLKAGIVVSILAVIGCITVSGYARRRMSES